MVWADVNTMGGTAGVVLTFKFWDYLDLENGSSLQLPLTPDIEITKENSHTSGS